MAAALETPAIAGRGGDLPKQGSHLSPRRQDADVGAPASPESGPGKEAKNQERGREGAAGRGRPLAGRPARPRVWRRTGRGALQAQQRLLRTHATVSRGARPFPGCRPGRGLSPQVPTEEKGAMSQQGGSPEWAPPPAGRGEAGSRHYLTHPPHNSGMPRPLQEVFPPPTPPPPERLLHCELLPCCPTAQVRELWPGPPHGLAGGETRSPARCVSTWGLPYLPPRQHPGLSVARGRDLPPAQSGSGAPLAPGKTQRPRLHLDSTVPARRTARPG